MPISPYIRFANFKSTTELHCISRQSVVTSTFIKLPKLYYESGRLTLNFLYLKQIPICLFRICPIGGLVSRPRGK